jgi:hypothetical protein
MAQHVYSFLGSKLHLVLEDEVAESYNRAVDAFLDAQVEHEKTHGRKWDPVNEPLLMEINDRDKEVHNQIGDLINFMVKINGGGLDIPEEECTDDHFVRIEDGV